MGGLLSCGRSSSVSDFAEFARETVGKGVPDASTHPNSCVLNLTETQLDEFRQCFNSFDAECVMCQTEKTRRASSSSHPIFPS